MSYTFNFNLEFNQDCDNPTIGITDFFEYNEGAGTILNQDLGDNLFILDDGLIIDYYSSACDNQCEESEVTESTTVINMLVSELPEEYTFEDNTLYIPVTAGINKIGITIKYVNTETEEQFTVYLEKSIFTDCNLLCCIVNSLIEDINNTELVGMYESIEAALECNNLTVACFIYDSIREMLSPKYCNRCK
jgi:hypothetical protein